MKSKKDIRVVFKDMNRWYCPDCSFNGNYTQVKLHLRITHQYKDKILQEKHIVECCTMCEKEFITKSKARKHMLAFHHH